MKKRILLVLAIAFVLFNLVDILLTWGILNRGGVEANPVMGLVIGMGFLESVMWKVALAVLFAAALVKLRKPTILTVLTTAVVGICIWNGLGLISML